MSWTYYEVLASKKIAQWGSGMRSGEFIDPVTGAFVDPITDEISLAALMDGENTSIIAKLTGETEYTHLVSVDFIGHRDVTSASYCRTDYYMAKMLQVVPPAAPKTPETGIKD